MRTTLQHALFLGNVVRAAMNEWPSKDRFLADIALAWDATASGRNEADEMLRQLAASTQETFPDHICRHGHPDRTCRECFPLNRRAL